MVMGAVMLGGITTGPGGPGQGDAAGAPDERIQRVRAAGVQPVQTMKDVMDQLKRTRAASVGGGLARQHGAHRRG